MNRIFLCALLASLLSVTASAAGKEDSTNHWSFRPVGNPPLPDVSEKEWVRQSLDYFILAKLEAAGLEPPPTANRATLIRRVYFDLIGLPPSLEEVEAFTQSSDPEAYEKLINRLLESKHYGERWGRHWLDVARYGDSNGGDENLSYPHAYRYRDYVINAFNVDLPFDQFLVEQLAGDLISNGSTDRLAATGFLAIGTKILAEQDGIKKRADIVDEQIDTVGKALMGLTLGCARCHDHKFNPIPATDYYALAGIFHSTVIEDRSLETESYRKELVNYRNRLADFQKRSDAVRKQVESFIDLANVIEREAETFDRGNVVVDSTNYGKDIGIISDPGGQANFAEYDVSIEHEGSYLLQLRYAASNARPGRILVNGEVVRDPAITEATGGWMPENQQWIEEGFIELEKGNHVLRIESKPMMSHIDKFKLTPLKQADGAMDALAKLQSVAKERNALEKNKPRPATVMAVKDGEVEDAKLNRRGNPHDLGKSVPRGFLSKIGPKETVPVAKMASGRIALAQWLAHPNHPLTSRVIVNRVWRWHFGKGLTSSMNNFGLNGSPPTHPQLLDHLARGLIKSSWSLKQLHREIMLSSTYRMASSVDNKKATASDPENRLYWKRELNRMEAESFRDSLLQFSGTLNTEPPPIPLQVKSQDPSPGDIEKNRAAYEGFPHRSVYLPVVRSHIYDMMTLLDFPNATTPVGNRVTTTVPTQALLMLNNPFLIEQAEKLVEQLNEASAVSELEQLKRLYLTVLNRPATDREIRSSISFLDRYTKAKSSKDAWTGLAQTLLISNDFIYIR